MKKYLKKIQFISALIVTFLPYVASASTIYIDTGHSDFFVDDTVILNVRVNSESKKINAVEGTIMLDYVPKSISIDDVSLAGSSFTIWPSEPALSVDSKGISFVGGVPGGLNSTDAVLFKIVLNLKKPGQIVLSPSAISVYLNDGKGTKDSVHYRDLTVNILPKKPDSITVNDLDNTNLVDNTPPKPFVVFLGQDSSVFDGKKFLSFTAVDNQSGIDYYEVIEGNERSVQSENTYVLLEQNKKVNVTVIAHDKSGNVRTSVYSDQAPRIAYLIFLLLFLLAVGLVVFKKKIIFLR